MHNLILKLKDKKFWIILIIFLVILLLPVSDMSVQVLGGSSYPKQPLFMVFIPRCGKGNIVCDPFYKIWETFYYLYN